MASTTKKIWDSSQINDMVTMYISGNSCNDIAVTYGVAKNTIRGVLLESGISLNKARSISKKATGRPSKRKGTKASEETRLKMRSIDRTHYKRTTGRIYTEEQRQKMKDAWARRKAALPPKEARIKKPVLKTEERILREKQRARYKNLYRRLIVATGKKKCTKTEAAMGYTRQEFVTHIESQFKEGMSWSIRESFHVDHITPVDAFLTAGIYEPKRVNALSNLQPLYPAENRAKSNKIINGTTVYKQGQTA